MEKERIDIIDFKKEAKRRERKEKFKAKLHDVYDAVYRNKDLIIRFAPAVLGVCTVSIKAVSKHRSQRKEEELKELYCYDRSLGHYWRLRRKLTNSEWIEIEKRKQDGERLGDILEEMKVLK